MHSGRIRRERRAAVDEYPRPRTAPGAAAIAGPLLAGDELTGQVVSGIAAAAHGAGSSSCDGARVMRFPSSQGEDSGEFVRCPGLRDPAQARPEEFRGPLAGRGPRQVQVVHDRALADSYRAELVRAARKGLAFAPAIGEPES